MSHNLLLKSLAYREAGLSLLTMAIRMKKRLPSLLLNAAVVLLRPRLRSSSSTSSITFTNTISDLAIREKPKPRPRGRPPKTAAVVEDSDEEGANEAQVEAPENDDQEEEPVYVTANYISNHASSLPYSPGKVTTRGRFSPDWVEDVFESPRKQ